MYYILSIHTIFIYKEHRASHTSTHTHSSKPHLTLTRLFTTTDCYYYSLSLFTAVVNNIHWATPPAIH